ncbi:MAG: alpha-glucan family phosphorylase [Candidatus Theseobacter exili]|nr:alpha-glucan family phosphorylase [Candidatus Theseobacter exili]
MCTKKQILFPCLVLISCVFFMLSCITSAHSVAKRKTRLFDRIDNKLLSSYFSFPENSKTDINETPFILLVRDLHADYEAQMNIANAIDVIAKRSGITPLVLVEGASGQVDTSFFGTFPESKIRKQITAEFVRQGLLTGPEYLSIARYGSLPIDIWGIEDADLYKQNFQGFRKVLTSNEKAKPWFSALDKILESLKSKIYNKKLFTLDLMAVNYSKGQIGLEEYITYLTVMTDHSNYPNLLLFQLVCREKEAINEKLVENEKNSLISKLGSHLEKHQIAELIQKSLEYRLGRVDSTSFLEYLDEKSKEAEISIDTDFPELSRALKLFLLQRKIHIAELESELSLLNDRLAESMLQNKHEAELLQLSKRVKTIEKLSELHLTRETLAFYKSQKGACKPQNILNTLETLANSVAVEIPEVLNQNSVLHATENLLIEAVNFYRVALLRDNALIFNALAKMEEKKFEQAIMITGGFHTRGIENVLRKKGIAFLVATPKVYHVSSDKVYLSRMLDKRFSSGTIAIPSVFSELIDRLSQDIQEEAWQAISHRYLQSLRESILEVDPSLNPTIIAGMMQATLDQWFKQQKSPTPLENRIYSFLEKQIEKPVARSLAPSEISALERGMSMAHKQGLDDLEQVLKNIVKEVSPEQTTESISEENETSQVVFHDGGDEELDEFFRQVNKTEGNVFVNRTDKRSQYNDISELGPVSACYIDWFGTFDLADIPYDKRTETRIKIIKKLKASGIHKIHIITDGSITPILSLLERDGLLDMIDSVVGIGPSQVPLATPYKQGHKILRVTSAYTKSQYILDKSKAGKILFIDDTGRNFKGSAGGTIVRLGITTKNKRRLDSDLDLGDWSDMFIASLSDLTALSGIVESLNAQLIKHERLSVVSRAKLLANPENIITYARNLLAVDTPIKGPVRKCYMSWKGVLSSLDSSYRLELFKNLSEKGIEINIIVDSSDFFTSEGKDFINNTLMVMSDKEKNYLNSVVQVSDIPITSKTADVLTEHTLPSGKKFKTVVSQNSKSGYISEIASTERVIVFDLDMKSFPEDSDSSINIGIAMYNPLRLSEQHIKNTDYFLSNLRDFDSFMTLLNILNPPVPPDIAETSSVTFCEGEEDLDKYFSRESGNVFSNWHKTRLPGDRTPATGPVKVCYIDWAGTLEFPGVPANIVSQVRKRFFKLLKHSGIVEIHILSAGKDDDNFIPHSLEVAGVLDLVDSVITKSRAPGESEYTARDGKKVKTVRIKGIGKLSYIKSKKHADKVLMIDDTPANLKGVSETSNIIGLAISGKDKGIIHREKNMLIYPDYLIHNLSDLKTFEGLLSILNKPSNTDPAKTVSQSEWNAMGFDEDLARTFTGDDKTAFSQSFVDERSDNIRSLAEYWLNALALNSWTEWSDESHDLFLYLDSELWQEAQRNPKQFIESLSYEKLLRASRDPEFLELIYRAARAYKRYLNRKETIVSTQYPELVGRNVTYSSMEYGIDQLRIYGGGLGILSGDHTRGASDAGLDFMGMGLLYRRGYFEQEINPEGWQGERYEEVSPEMQGISPALDLNGNEIIITVQLPERIVHVKVWEAIVGHTKLFLMDTNLEENHDEDREITKQLYANEKEIQGFASDFQGKRPLRLEQELILGLASERALKAMGITPDVYHINEGHVVFRLLEAIRQLMDSENLSFAEAREAISSKTGFTLHTPVPAGNELFDAGMAMHYLKDTIDALGIDHDEFKEMAVNKSGQFDMSKLALNLSGAYNNGVSRLHGRVSQQLWRDEVFPQIPVEEVPIGAVTNSVHGPYWQCREIRKLIEKQGGIERTDSIPDKDLWKVHQDQKRKLVNYVRDRKRTQTKREFNKKKDAIGKDDQQGLSKLQKEEASALEAIDDLLDPDVFTIGFARRFATYKRATMLFNDAKRLIDMMNNKDKPVQIIFAGKSHPADEKGKELIRQINKYAEQVGFKGKLVFVENYNIDLARHMESGCDIWLNNPIRPHEASGTSGMKAGMNGCLNVSIPDGWCPEGIAHRINGWLFGEGSETSLSADANELYQLLEEEVLPIYYENDANGVPHRWLRMMKAAIKDTTVQFGTDRFISEYIEKMYLPAIRRGDALKQNNYEMARKLTSIKKDFESRWPNVSIIKWGNSQNILTATPGRPYVIDADVDLAGLDPEDISVEIWYGKPGKTGWKAIPIRNFRKIDNGILSFSGEIEENTPGNYKFKVRIIPKHPQLRFKHETGLVRWGDGDNLSFQVMNDEQLKKNNIRSAALHDIGTFIGNLFQCSIYMVTAPALSTEKSQAFLEEIRKRLPLLADRLETSEKKHQKNILPAVSALLNDFQEEANKLLYEMIELNNKYEKYRDQSFQNQISEKSDKFIQIINESNAILQSYLAVVPDNPFTEQNLSYKIYKRFSFMLKIFNTVKFILDEALTGNLSTSSVITSASDATEQILSNLGAQYDIEVEIETRPDTTAPFLMNPGHMKRIFSNLIKNTWESLREIQKENEGKLKIAIIENPDNKTVSIRYTDNAGGISKDNIDSIFSFGFSTKSSDSHKRGIGLSSVKDMVEMAGGKIEVESVQGKGTTFIITFPIAMTEAEWEKTIDTNWNNLSISEWGPVGLLSETVLDEPVEVTTEIDLSGIDPAAVSVEIWHGLEGDPEWIAVEMNSQKLLANGKHLFTGAFRPSSLGTYGFKVRVTTDNPNTESRDETTQRILWAPGNYYTFNVINTAATKKEPFSMSEKDPFDISMDSYEEGIIIDSLKEIAKLFQITWNEDIETRLLRAIRPRGNPDEYPYPDLLSALSSDGQPVDMEKMNLLNKIGKVLQNNVYTSLNKTKYLTAGIVEILLQGKLNTISDGLSRFHSKQNDSWAYMSYSTVLVEGLKEKTIQQTDAEMNLHRAVFTSDTFLANGDVFLKHANLSSTIKDKQNIALFDFDLIVKDSFAGLKTALEKYENFFSATGFFSDTYSSEEIREILVTVLGEEHASRIAAINISDAMDGEIFSKAVDEAMSDPTINALTGGPQNINTENIILVGTKSRRGDYGDISEGKVFFADRFSSFAQILVTVLLSEDPQLLKSALLDAGFTDKEIDDLIPDGQDIPPSPNPEIKNFMQRIDNIEKARRAIATMA